MNSNIDEKEWVIQMSSLLTHGDHNIDIKNPVCIFQVPKSIRNTKPEAYTPQVVALGPYHHFRPKTYYMQKCKLSAALKARQQLKLGEFPEMYNAIKDTLFDIRASYHDSLSLEHETLAWMMLIDGLFLMSLIEKKFNSRQAGQSDELEDLRGRKHSMNEILKDVVLLENQIPQIVLEALFGGRSNIVKYIELRGKMTYFCTNLTPVDFRGDRPGYEVKDSRHLLDFLHQLVWLGTERLEKSQPITGNVIKESDLKHCGDLYSMLSNIKFGPLSVILSMVELTLKILSALGISVPRDIFSEKEVLMPSASQLTVEGLKFCGLGRRSRGGVKDIAFSKTTESVTLSLPVLKINTNSELSEVVMRNLLAYEAEAMPESPKFSRYVEIMSALMQTSADVDLLKNAGTSFHIVPQDADSSKVVELFAGLKEAVGSKGESELDKTIKEVNEYYDNCRKVKIRRLAKRYLFVSWKVLSGIALVLVLILLILQTFCSLYSCPKIFKS